MDTNALLKQLTLEEKCALISGVNFWHTTPIKRLNIPSVMMADGPHGLRKELKTASMGNIMQKSQPATCFPPAVTMASTWDRDAVAAVGNAIGIEAIDQELSTVLGPGVNIKRNPLCGRNFEYFSEDPYLAGELAASYINALQANKVGTSLKHYAVNSQEYRRLTISSEVDDRAMREIYFAAFEKAVKKSQPYTIMCSYNRINGLHASDNKWLLTDVLREEWGYKGIVVSDWGAVNNRTEAVKAGLDLEMPSSDGKHDGDVLESIKAGRLKEEELDKVVLRMLDYVYKCYDNLQENKDKKCDYEANHALARRVAASGAVLLKNDGMLPMEKGSDTAIIGAMAKTMRYQGGGSSNINPKQLVNFTDCLDALKVEYSYAAGYSLIGDGSNKALLDEAVALAKTKKNVVIFAGLTDEYESEGFDREHLEMPLGHNTLIEEISKVNKNITVVLSCGSPVQMPWLNKVNSVLNIYLGGEAAGEACYDLLFGDITPSGKLAETFPLCLGDNPAYGEKYFQAGPRTVEHRESIFVGYRYFDAAKKEVLFPFGYGLSYTSFEYSNFKVEKSGKTAIVSFDVENTGSFSGAEVAQVYVRDIESTVFREEKALKGFAKVFLKKGEKKSVTIELDERAFSFYNTEKKDWTIEEGEFEIMVGASSVDIKFSERIFVEGEKNGMPDYRVSAPVYYDIKNAVDYPAADFEALLGRPLSSNEPYKKGEIELNSTLGDVGVTAFGRFFIWIVKKVSTSIVDKDASDATKTMVRKTALVMPLRSLYAMTNGAVPRESIEGLVMMFNGKFFKGLGRLIKYFFKNRKQQRKYDLYAE